MIESGFSTEKDLSASGHVKHTCQYMENQRPILPLGSQAGLGTATTSEGHPLLFAVDTGNVFHVSVSADGGTAPWANYPIAGAVLTQYDEAMQAVPKLFTVSQQQECGSLSVVLAVTSLQNGVFVDDLWLLAEAASAPDSSWITQDDGAWVKLPFNLKIENIVADQLDVQYLAATPMTVSGGSSDDSPSAMVCLKDSNENLIPFAVNLSGSSSEWQPMQTSTSFKTVADLEAGRPAQGSTGGMYALFTDAKQVVNLQWMSPADDTMVYSTPGTPTALAVLPVLQSSDSGVVYTDLFVSDAQGLHFFTYDSIPAADGKIQPAMSITSSTLAGCAELHVSTDGVVVSMWGMNGAGTVFHLQAPYDSRSTASDWTNPVPMLPQITQMAMHISQQRGLTSLFAVQGSGDDMALYEVHKDPMDASGGHWRKVPIHLAVESGFTTLQTYTHRLQFTNDLGQPAGNKTVTVSTTASVVLEINGLTVTVPSSPSSPVTVTTTAAGVLDVMQIVPTAAAPTLTFSLAADASSEIDSAESISIDPTHGVRAAVSTKLSSSATLPSGWSGKQLMSHSQAVGSVHAINDAHTSSESSSSSSEDGLVGGTELGSSSGVLGFLGDVCLAIAEDIEGVLELEVQALELIVTLAEGAFTALINTVEDIAAAFVSILQAIGAALDDIFQWLAFLFDWDNIKDITDNISNFYQQIFTNLGPMAGALIDNLAEWVDYYGSLLKNGGGLASNMPSSSTTQATNTGSNAIASNKPSQAPSPSGTDPRMSWGQSQANQDASSGSVAQQLAMRDAIESSSSAGADLEDVGQELISFLENVAEEIKSLAGGSASMHDVLTGVEREAGDLVLAFGTLLQAMGSGAEDALNGLDDILQYSPTIPLFSSLFQELFSEPLNLLDLFALLQAVPIDFLYGLATDGKGKGSDVLAPSVVATWMSKFAAMTESLLVPPTSARYVASAGPLVRRELDSDDSTLLGFLRYLLGVAHGARIVTTCMVGESEQAVYNELNDVTVLLEALRMDAAAWVMEAAVELFIDCVEIGKPRLTTGLNITFACGALRSSFLATSSSSVVVHAVAGIMGGMSIVVGAVEIYEGLAGITSPDSSDEVISVLDSVGDCCYGINEVMEFLQIDMPSNATNLSAARAYPAGVAALGEVIAAGVLLF